MDLMTIISIPVSISSVVLQNCIINRLCKTTLQKSDYISYFNMILYIVCVVFFGVMLIGDSISVFTVTLGIIFGVLTALNSIFKMHALLIGPMHITMLIITSSMIIPALSGIFFGEAFSLYKLIFVFILIGFIYMSLEKKEGGKIDKKWFIYCMLSFIMQGAIGVLQKIHQASPHSGEVNGFLLASFACSVIFCRLRIKGDIKQIKFDKKIWFLAIVCGLCSYLMNVINLKLSGIIPSQLFFPLINGSVIILTSFASLILFKEKLSNKQLVGLFGGIVSLICLAVVK